MTTTQQQNKHVHYNTFELHYKNTITNSNVTLEALTLSYPILSHEPWQLYYFNYYLNSTFLRFHRPWMFRPGLGSELCQSQQGGGSIVCQCRPMKTDTRMRTNVPARDESLFILVRVVFNSKYMLGTFDHPNELLFIWYSLTSLKGLSPSDREQDSVLCRSSSARDLRHIRDLCRAS